MDNTGPYLSYAELIGELFTGASAKVTSADTTLSNKTTDAGGDIYDFASGAPEIGSIIYQAGYVDEVIAMPSPTKIQVSKTGAANKIKNGPAKVLKAPSIPKARGEDLILEAMDFIDEQTGQFFNKRSGDFKIQGNNTSTMFLPVPIIEIEELKINSTDLELTEGEDQDFVAFKGRQRPADDRRNPKIVLGYGRTRTSIFSAAFSSRIFAKNTIQHIKGSFGFLEEDGSTPKLIKKAVKILAIGQINEPISSSAGSGGDVGPVKKIKVDLHEKEFFEAASNKAGATSKSDSGDEEVDNILAKYRCPIRIDGSFTRSPYEEVMTDV